MPRPAFPPTPAPSTDIKGKESGHVSHPGSDFVLPPSAMPSRSNSASSRDPIEPPKPSVSPISPQVAPQDEALSRKRSHAQSVSMAVESSLPPPPSRSRKIIQVKPKEQHAKRASTATNADDEEYDPNGKSGAQTAGKAKKGATTSAGRKIARKTAHSLIERRRRSKMNEEFGVLKDLIPACRGHEMHKLAILQASIDYLRYLENCIADLKSDGQPHPHPATRPAQPETGRSAQNEIALQSTSSDDEEEDNEDEEMIDRDEYTQQPPLKQHKASVSQIAIPQTASTVATPTFPNYGPYRDSRHYSQASSEAPSPFFGAQQHGREWYRPTSQSSYPASPSLHSQQTSPMLLPQGQGQSSDLDREASAALLMLNASDRRTSISHPARNLANARDRPSMKGISVKDLLSN